jgi:predicted ATP-dependent serine protease
MPSIPCADCGNDIPQPASCCPHCGRWAQYWNVINADKADERTALEDRYDKAKADALARGADAAVQDFETAAAESKAVIARSIAEVQRLANSTNEIFGPYYRLIEAELKLRMATNGI